MNTSRTFTPAKPEMTSLAKDRGGLLRLSPGSDVRPVTFSDDALRQLFSAISTGTPRSQPPRTSPGGAGGW